jgi:hypothetical protein
MHQASQSPPERGHPIVDPGPRAEQVDTTGPVADDQTVAVGDRGHRLGASALHLDVAGPPDGRDGPLAGEVTGLHLEQEPVLLERRGEVGCHWARDDQQHVLGANDGAARREGVALGVEVQEVGDGARLGALQLLAQQRVQVRQAVRAGDVHHPVRAEVDGGFVEEQGHAPSIRCLGAGEVAFLRHDRKEVVQSMSSDSSCVTVEVMRR